MKQHQDLPAEPLCFQNLEKFPPLQMAELQKKTGWKFSKAEDKINILGLIANALFYYTAKLRIHLRSLRSNGLNPLLPLNEDLLCGMPVRCLCMKLFPTAFFHLGLIEVSLGVRSMEREYSVYHFWPCSRMCYNFRPFNLHEKLDLLSCLSAPTVGRV